MGATLFNPADADSGVHQSTPAPNTPPAHTDILIVGAGIIGLTTAYRLQRTGRTVTLLDPAPASEATRAAAGMLAPASEVQFRQEPLVPLMKRAAELYAELAADIQHTTGENVGLRDTPTLVCSYDTADKQALTELADYQRELGLETTPISIRTARTTEPVLSPRLTGAIEITGDHQINPRWFASALAKHHAGHIHPVTATGVQIEDAPHPTARAVTWRDQQWSTGTTTAEHIIIANGLGATALRGIPEVSTLPLRPVYGDVLRLRIPKNQRPFLTSTVRGVVRGNPVYIVPREDNTLVIGATSREDHLPGINAGGVYQLLRDAHDLIPAITELELYEVISRARPGTPDDLPLIGPVHRDGRPIEHLTVSNGYFRHGILLASRGSEIVTHLITDTLTDDDHRDLTACAPQRFNTTHTP